MKILPITCAAMLAVSALAPGAAKADVTYMFTGEYNDGNTGRTETATFTFTTPHFVTGRIDATPSSCSTTSAFYVCSSTQRLENYPTGFGPNVVGDFIGLNLTNADALGSLTDFYFFDPAAFGAGGTYLNTGFPNPNGPGTTGGFYGNAGFATLVVSGVSSVVPEPASWAMLILGFGTVGALLRRRHARPAMLRPANI